ncbi:hypothetical protein GXP67_20440 [Rhodocytophaga rosea]|uniref:Glycosyltransferase RgtA/B/C/D-like domain-containing protein n=2 Tax=Rhodocytophaga rosea TaxID=2704465 RepID=A0A6C0GLN2_9BACT|nr:hypothetical protein GXP67_20440 [Rhodocytophaga rosea]
MRLFRLDYQSLWYDELHSIIPTAPGNTVASIIEYCKKDQPPAFFLLLHGWFQVFPYNDYSGRLLSVILGIGGIIAIFFLGKEIKNSTVGIAASAITTFNWFHINYSQELRFYTLLFLLTVLSFWFFIRAYKQSTFLHFFLYSVCSVALIYTHYYAMVVLASQLIIFIGLLIFFDKRGIKMIVLAILSGILICVAFIPWMPTVLADNNYSSFWIAMPKLYFPAVYLYVYLGKDPYYGIVVLVLGILLISYAIQLYKQTVTTSEEKTAKKSIFILFLWIILSYLIPFLYSVLALPMLHERYTIISLPALFIAFGWGWSLIENMNIRRFVPISIFLSTIINLLFFNQHYSRIYKMQLRELSQEVININRATHSNPLIYSTGAWYFNYYFNLLQPDTLVRDINGINLEQNMANADSIWVLEAAALDQIDEINKTYIEKHFVPRKEISLFQTSAVLYERVLASSK